MTENINVDYIRQRIKNFKLPPTEYFAECMFTAQNNENIFGKGGIFICGQDSVGKYESLAEFWVRSFYALIENVWLGDLFHEVIPLIHWDEIPTEKFTQNYFGLIKNYTPEPFFLECQAYKESYVEIENRKFTDAVSVLNGEVTSSIAKSDGGYVSYFILSDEIAIRGRKGLLSGNEG